MHLLVRSLSATHLTRMGTPDTCLRRHAELPGRESCSQLCSLVGSENSLSLSAPSIPLVRTSDLGITPRFLHVYPATVDTAHHHEYPKETHIPKISQFHLNIDLTLRDTEPSFWLNYLLSSDDQLQGELRTGIICKDPCGPP
jgi:hypothetical protein